MRLDHIAYRVLDKEKTVKFFKSQFGYTEQDEFEIILEDDSMANCTALEPPEKQGIASPVPTYSYEYFHLAPEIFVSSGPKGSLIYNWVKTYGNGVGGIHHLAYQVTNIDKKIKEWKGLGYSFTTPQPLECEGLRQIFSDPHPLTGVIYEFIQRTNKGFCKENVGNLMNSTKGLQ